MRPMEGFENLQPRKVLGVTPEGRLLAVVNDDTREFDMFINAQGGLQCKPVPKPEPTAVDQDISDKPPKRVPVQERWRGVDQAEGVLKRS